MSLAQPTTQSNPSPEEVYQTFLRSLRRRKGFGIVFVQCSPAKAAKLIDDVKKDLPQKSVATLSLTEPIENLYKLIDKRTDKNTLNILFIQGIEKSLESYIKPGYGGDGNYYNLDTVPRILSHLNQQRENFRDHFGNICFVFILPLFAVKYFIRRAPDFFDWSSGVFELPTDPELMELETTRIIQEVNTQQYADLDLEKCKHKILEIQSWLDEPFQGTVQRAELLLQQGNLFTTLDDHESALSSYQQALLIKPNDIPVLFNQGSSFMNLGRFEEAAESYEEILKNQPDNYKALAEQGDALMALGRYEESVENYEKALEIDSEIAWIWANRGYALRNLQRNQEAIESYDKALKIEPDNHQVWNQKGILLHGIGFYKEAVENYDHALELKPDFYYALSNRGDALESLGRCKESIASYDQALAIRPDNYHAWFYRGQALCRIGRSEDGISSYDKVLELNPRHSVACHNRALALSGIGRYEEAVIGFRRAIELKPGNSSAVSWMCLGGALKSLRRYEESLACFDKAIELTGGGRHFEWGGRVIPLLRLGRFGEAIISAYKACLNFRPDRGFREWLERRIAIYLKQFRLQILVKVWVNFLNLIGWRVRDW